MSDHHFAFDLLDRVRLKEVQRPGVIESMSIDTGGASYRVAFWDNGDRKTVWVREDEIEKPS